MNADKYEDRDLTPAEIETLDRLLPEFKKVYDRGKELDPNDGLHWDSVAVGWFAAQDISPTVAGWAENFWFDFCEYGRSAAEQSRRWEQRAARG